ncbi:hypothetical protein JCM8097_007217 [Rhodosporidiobolus ruineniae]
MAPSSGQLARATLSTFLSTDPLAPVPDPGAGSGSHLPAPVLVAATVSAGLATLLSLWTVWLQLRHYHRPRLQRFVVRILVMVPVYSVAALISLYSLDLAFFIDAFRDVYEAFVIYCFFQLLVEYLGGERSLLITLHGRPPHPHPAPIRWCLPPMDASDPFTFLGLKRGILQYVQLKPILAVLTVVLKAFGKYDDGHLAKDSGYTYVSIVYNLSVSLSLYCLAMFWVATHDDLKPYRPMPKFLCVKGLIFATFWQGFAVSILVALGLIRSDRYETEQLSLAIQDTLIALELPLFAFLHLYAFSYTDYIDSNHVYSGRLPVWVAFKDAFGYKDLLLDSLETFHGRNFSYRTFEPASGALHAEGLVRDRRIAAGLRYSVDGKKYWLNMPKGPNTGRAGEAYTRQGLRAGLAARPVHEVKRRLERRIEVREGYAPLSHDEEVLHVARAGEAEEGLGELIEEGEGGEREGRARKVHWWERHREYDELSDESDGASSEGSLEFHGPADEEDEPSSAVEVDAEEQKEERRKKKVREWEDMERLYEEAKELEYGDWHYPVVDASRDAQRRRLRDEENALLSGRFDPYTGKHRPPSKGKGKETRPEAKHRPGSYGAMAERQAGPARPSPSRSASSRSRPPPASRTLSSPHDEPSSLPDSHPATAADHPAAIGSSLVDASTSLLKTVLPFSFARSSSSRSSNSASDRERLPPDAVDLVVEDTEAEEEEQIRQRRRGEPSGRGRTRVYRVAYAPPELEGSRDRAEGAAGGTREEPKLKKGAEVVDPVEGEHAEVKDVLPASSADGDNGNSGEGSGKKGADEVVLVAVTEEEQTAMQAGVDDETSRRVENEDNPWR